jgi:uncharacterized membrane protein YdbT with pleckstrin-like domain
MSYVESNLLPGEVVTYRARRHRIMFFWPGFILAIGVLVALPALLGGTVAGAVPAMVILLIGGVAALLQYMAYSSAEFAITDKRVVIKVGVLSRHTIELLLTKVETVGLDQGIFGRMFGYGTIVVTGTGGTKEPFKGVANPLEFRKRVQAQLAA